jgi:hypothetical protein
LQTGKQEAYSTSGFKTKQPMDFLIQRGFFFWGGGGEKWLTLNGNVNGQRNKYQKSKAIPLQAWTGPEGSRKLGLPDFNTIGI